MYCPFWLWVYYTFDRCAFVATVEVERHRKPKADKKGNANSVQTRLILKDALRFRRVVCGLRKYSTKPSQHTAFVLPNYLIPAYITGKHAPWAVLGKLHALPVKHHLTMPNPSASERYRLLLCFLDSILSLFSDMT